MKILITGGGGFIGSQLAAALKKKHPGATITLLDMAFPPALDREFTCIAGDMASPEVIAGALGADTSPIT